MRYENENPQVKFFREEAEKWEDLAKKALAEAKEWKESYEERGMWLKKWEELHRVALRWSDEWRDKFLANKKKMEEFNKLPWWKKMFFNFKSE